MLFGGKVSISNTQTQLFSGTDSLSLFFLVAAPLKMVQAPKRVPFFSRVTEQLSKKTPRVAHSISPGLGGGLGFADTGGGETRGAGGEAKQAESAPSLYNGIVMG